MSFKLEIFYTSGEIIVYINLFVSSIQNLFGLAKSFGVQILLNKINNSYNNALLIKAI